MDYDLINMDLYNNSNNLIRERNTFNLQGIIDNSIFAIIVLVIALIIIKIISRNRIKTEKFIFPLIILGLIFNFIGKNPLFIMLIILFSMCLYSIYFYVKGKREDNRNNDTKLKTINKDKAEGFIFGKVNNNKVAYSPTDEEGHIVIFGGSGSGKTSALLIPSLRVWKGNAFVIDISGDIIKNVPNNNAIVYDVEDKNTIPFNIFGSIDLMLYEEDRNEALEKLAFLLMPDDVNEGSNAKFFKSEGRKILTASLICFYKQGYDFIQIAEKVVRNSWKDLFREIDESQNINAIQYINSFIGANEANTAGCKQAADGVLKLFATNERIKKGIRRPKQNEKCFTPSTLEKQSVYVKIEDAKLDLYAPILHIITAQVLEFLSARENKKDPKILLCLDEFASLGKMEIIGALRKLRKKNVRIAVLTQSLADLDLIYGVSERKAMMNNFQYKVILQANDTDTQEYFAKLIGQVEREKQSTTQKGVGLFNDNNDMSITTSMTKEFIIEPSSLGRLKNNLIVLHPNGYEQLEKNFYFKK